MRASSTSPTPPEQHLFSKPILLTPQLQKVLQKPDGVARYYEMRAVQRQKLTKLVEEVTSNKECTKGAELLATNLRKFHKI